MSKETSPHQGFSHLSPSGDAHMVGVGEKEPTLRTAVASARVRTTEDVVARIQRSAVDKGDVLGVARVAAILAAKRTSDLIPLCHPVATTRISVDLETRTSVPGEIVLTVRAEAFDRTGVEMEAMVGASVGALTLYDMIKSIDRWATIEQVRLEEKRGGKSGHVRRGASHE